MAHAIISKHDREGHQMSPSYAAVIFSYIHVVVAPVNKAAVASTGHKPVRQAGFLSASIVSHMTEELFRLLL